MWTRNPCDTDEQDSSRQSQMDAMEAEGFKEAQEKGEVET